MYGTLLDSEFTSSIFWRLKTSFVQELYANLFNRAAIDSKSHELHSYRKLTGLSPGNLVFDIGANDGSKTVTFLKLGATVVAVEPDEKNQRILHDRFLRYRVFPKPVTVVGKAVSDSATTAIMLIDGPGSAVNTLNPKWAECLKNNRNSFQHTHFGLTFDQHKVVETTTIEDLIVTYGMPAYIKIDVEGYEVNVLCGLKRPVPLLSFEVNLPEFKSEGLECVRLLDCVDPSGSFCLVQDLSCESISDEWLSAQDISTAISHHIGSVEVFWRSSLKRLDN